MKKLFNIMLLCLAFASYAQVGTKAPKPIISSPVTIYQDANYSGISAVLGVGQYAYNQLGTVGNDNLSSIKVKSGYMAILFENSDLGLPGGNYKVVKANTTFIGNEWNDKVSHIIVLPDPGNDKALLFADANLKGNSKKISEGDNSLSATYNDITSSLYVPDGYMVTLYDNDPPSGTNTTFESGVHLSIPANLNDKASFAKMKKRISYFPGPVITLLTPIEEKYNSTSNGVTIKSLVGNTVPGKNETEITGGKYRVYQNGAIYYSAATGAHELHGAVFTKYETVRNNSNLGFPTSDIIVVNVVGETWWYATFEFGAIYHNPATSKTYVISGKIGIKYNAMGGHTSVLGLPKSGNIIIRKIPETGPEIGQKVIFEKGVIFQKKNREAFYVDNAGLNKYDEYGNVHSPFGFPTKDPVIEGTIVTATFEHGLIKYEIKNINLTVFSQNMALLPQIFYKGFKTGSNDRLGAINEFLRYVAAEKPDVIGLSEVWDRDERAVIIESLSNPAYPDIYYRYNAAGPWRAHFDGDIDYSHHGGLLLLSKYPITNVEDNIYPHDICSGDDCLKDKGLIFVTVTKPDAGPVNIILSHTQSQNASIADGGLRFTDPVEAVKKQLETMMQYAAAKQLQYQNPMIIMGDLNWDMLDKDQKSYFHAQFVRNTLTQNYISNLDYANKGIQTCVGATINYYNTLNPQGFTWGHNASFGDDGSPPYSANRFDESAGGIRIDHHLTIQGHRSVLTPSETYVTLLQMPGYYDISDHYGVLSRYTTKVDYLPYEVWCKGITDVVNIESIHCNSESRWTVNEGDSDEPSFVVTVNRPSHTSSEYLLPTPTGYYDDVDGGEYCNLSTEDKASKTFTITGALNFHLTGTEHNSRDVDNTSLGEYNIPVDLDMILVHLNTTCKLSFPLKNNSLRTDYSIISNHIITGILLDARP